MLHRQWQLLLHLPPIQQQRCDSKTDPLVKSSAFQCLGSSPGQQWSCFSSHKAAVRITRGNKMCLVHNKCSINIRLLPFQPPQPLILSLYPQFLLFFWYIYIYIYTQWICYSVIYFKVLKEGLNASFERRWNNCAMEATCPLPVQLPTPELAGT